jgi:hypothetical protein
MKGRITMRDFFAGLRLVLAYTNLEKMNIGAIAHQFIRDTIIPSLQKRKEKAKTDTDIDRYDRLIEQYELYSNMRNPEAKVFDSVAANIIRHRAQQSSLNDEDTEDLMQTLALGFFQPLRVDGNDLRQTMEKYMKDQEKGPLFLKNYWAHIVDLRTQYFIREWKRKHKETTFRREENDEGDELDPMVNIRAPSQIDEGYVRQVMKDLENYVHKNVRNSKYSELFDVWFDLAQKKGADKVRMDKDVYSVLRDRGFEGTEPTFNYHWMEVKRIIARFFQKELEGEGYNGIKKILRMSSVEFVAYTEYRRRLAAWVLEGVDRKLLEV